MQYVVHRASDHHHKSPVKLADGTTVDAFVPTFEVELVPESGAGLNVLHCSAVKLAFQGNDAVAAAKAVYVQGKVIVAEFAPLPTKAA